VILKNHNIPWFLFQSLAGLCPFLFKLTGKSKVSNALTNLLTMQNSDQVFAKCDGDDE